MIVPKFHFIQHLIALSGDPLLGLTIVLVVFGIVGLIHFVFKKIPKLSPKQRKKVRKNLFLIFRLHFYRHGHLNGDRKNIFKYS